MRARGQPPVFLNEGAFSRGDRGAVQSRSTRGGAACL